MNRRFYITGWKADGSEYMPVERFANTQEEAVAIMLEMIDNGLTDVSAELI